MGGLVWVFLGLAALFAPLIIFSMLIYSIIQLFGTIKKLNDNESFLWLDKKEKLMFIQLYQERGQVFQKEMQQYNYDFEKALNENNQLMLKNEIIENKISDLHKKALKNGISKNKDGSYDRRSDLGRKIQEKVEELSSQLDHSNSFPHKPSFNFSVFIQKIPLERYFKFNRIYEEYHEAIKFVHEILWVCYGYIATIFILVLLFSISNILVIMFLSALVAITIYYYLHEKMKYNPIDYSIPSPPYVTIKNIDTYLPVRISSHYKDFFITWKKLTFGKNADIGNLEWEKMWNWADLNIIDEKIFPRDREKLMQLTELNLSNQHITELPCAIVYLENLKKLDLSKNDNIAVTPKQKNWLKENECVVKVSRSTKNNIYSKQDLSDFEKGL